MTTATLLSIDMIANTLIEKCKNLQFAEAIQELYAPDIISVEASAPANMPKETQGIKAVLEKCNWWTSNNEIHSIQVNGPLVAETSFAVHFNMDVTCSTSNERVIMSEIAVYEVKDGKIVREQFFYTGCEG